MPLLSERVLGVAFEGLVVDGFGFKVRFAY